MYSPRSYAKDKMPIAWLVDYWKKAAPATLPFLRGRKVAVQQKFGPNILYRRHGGKGLPDKIGWIEINSTADIMAWARLHTFSFHPHLNGNPLASSGRRGDVWFVMDIDSRADTAFKLAKIVAYEMSRLLDKKNARPDYIAPNLLEAVNMIIGNKKNTKGA